MWTESFKCNICGKQRTSFANDWWIAWTDDLQPADDEPRRPKLNLMPWSELMSRSLEAVHLCGLNCALKETERWLVATGNQVKREVAAS
jgi:hypothetical protein